MYSATFELEDGTKWFGVSFGYDKTISGEVVFNTAMTGYPESLSDPSYCGQILVLTYPIIGNYGIPHQHIEERLLSHFESERPQICALVVNSYSESFHHWNAQKSLSQWMIENNIVAIQGLDTRAITKHIRAHGSMLGCISIGDVPPPTHLRKWFNPNKINVIPQVSCKEKVTYGEGQYRVILIDCGTKYNIIRSLIKRGCTVIRVPWDYDYTQEDYDAILISNGPGNPENCKTTIEQLQNSLQGDKPIFGICLGCQLLGLASGGKAYKLKFGHRSHNQPVINTKTKKCYITSQNHNYALDINSLSDDYEVSYQNLNDNTCEGIAHKTKPFTAVQFHPEAFGGPEDTDFLFDNFVKTIHQSKT